jgi:hypothetical protein
MSFDTTSANTGRFRGTCVHHVMELILAKVFTVCFGSSSCPEIRIFMPFKSVWNDVIRSNYRGLELQPGTVFVESTFSCLKGVVERETQFRDDYQELIELTMILLGTPSTTIHWRARWMAKLLYAMKIFLFRDILKLTTINETQLRRFVQFGALLYTKAWIQAHVRTHFTKISYSREDKTHPYI